MRYMLLGHIGLVGPLPTGTVGIGRKPDDCIVFDPSTVIRLRPWTIVGSLQPVCISDRRPVDPLPVSFLDLVRRAKPDDFVIGDGREILLSHFIEKRVLDKMAQQN